MIIRVAVRALDKSPMLRRLLWRWWYARLAKRFTQASWTFMNYGYEADAGAEPTALDPEDEPDRLCAQLYEQVVTSIDLTDREVVEIGCGRGGGASFLARRHRPKRYTGIDYSANAVKLCRKTHAGIPQLGFVHGDAENLPLENGSCDIVVNVESSHCYGDVGKFFREVARVLRPGGHFAFADFRAANEMDSLEATLRQTQAMRILRHVDITDNVVAALVRDDARKRQLIEEIIPRRLQRTFGEFAGLDGGQVCTALQRREMVYHRFLLQKH